MQARDFMRLVKKYKKCPICGISYKTTDLTCEMKDETVTFTCKCGWTKSVDKDNKEV